MKILFHPAVAVACLAALFCFVRLGVVPFDDPGEGMHAEIARELMRSGDPSRLTLNGVVYIDKPPLLYFLHAAALSIVGESEASARAVSAAAAVAAVAATAWLGAKLLGAGGGALAGVALLSSALFFAYARSRWSECRKAGDASSGVGWWPSGSPASPRILSERWRRR